MKRVYNWDANTINFSDKYKNRYELQLRGKITIILGNSGTGKTFLVNGISNLQKENNNLGDIDKADNIIIIDKNNKELLKSQDGKLFIIDNADLILDDNDINTINMNDYNRYLIIARVAKGLDVSPNHYGELITDEKGVTTMYYQFNVKGWC